MDPDRDIGATGEPALRLVLIDWSTPGQRRHPVLLTLACVHLADQIVHLVWHDGYPHRQCQRPGCPYHRFKQAYNTGISAALPLLFWRRSVLLGAPWKSGTSAARIAAELAEGTPMWEADRYSRDAHSGLEILLAEMRGLAKRVGIPARPSPLDQVRQYMGDLLGILTAAPETPADKPRSD